MSTTSIQTAPFPELAPFGDRTGSPRPPLAAVLVGAEDHQCELVVTIDRTGHATVELHARGLEARGSAQIPLQGCGAGTTMAAGWIDLIGHDADRDTFVSGRAALALGWLTRNGSVEVIGTAVVDGIGNEGQIRFEAVAFHPFNHVSAHSQVEVEATLIPFPCHYVRTQPRSRRP